MSRVFRIPEVGHSTEEEEEEDGDDDEDKDEDEDDDDEDDNEEEEEEEEEEEDRETGSSTRISFHRLEPDMLTATQGRSGTDLLCIFPFYDQNQC